MMAAEIMAGRSPDREELKSRLNMSEVEVKITTTTSGGSPPLGGLGGVNLKKSRKSKNPIFRSQSSSANRRASSDNIDMNGQKSPAQAASDPDSPRSPPRSSLVTGLAAAAVLEKSSAGQPVINEPPLPPPPGGIKSYSDFMRSLAAKYNNNDYYTSTRNGLPSPTATPPTTSSLESPFQPFKTTSPTVTSATSVASAAAAAAASANPLLGFNPFSFGLSSLAEAASASFKGQRPPAAGLHAGLAAAAASGLPAGLPPGLPPGFPSMMDLHSTQALLSSLAAARSSPATASAFTPTNSDTAKSQKRPHENGTTPLDLSGGLLPPTPKKIKDAHRSASTSSSPSSAASRSHRNNSGSGSAGTDPTILNWTVAEVSEFVASIDICREYAEVFREHNIDGSSLPLLTEDHLTGRLGLKLGPALKLRSTIARKLGPRHAEICVHCSHCNNSKNSGSDEPPLERSDSRNSGEKLL